MFLNKPCLVNPWNKNVRRNYKPPQLKKCDRTASCWNDSDSRVCYRILRLFWVNTNINEKHTITINFKSKLYLFEITLFKYR